MKQCMTRKGSGQHMTLQKFQMTIFDTLEDKSMSSVRGSHVRLFQLLGNEKALRTLEGLYSLKSLVSQISSDHAIYTLRKSQDCSTMTTEIPLRPSSESWMNSGMMRNGMCLTLKTLEFPKTEKGCSLSDILEDNVPEKYFLSSEKAAKLIATL